MVSSFNDLKHMFDIFFSASKEEMSMQKVVLKVFKQSGNL